MNVGLDGVNRALHDEPDTHRGRQVKNNIAAVHEFRHERRVEDRVNGVLEPGKLL